MLPSVFCQESAKSCWTELSMSPVIPFSANFFLVNFSSKNGSVGHPLYTCKEYLTVKSIASHLSTYRNKDGKNVSK